MIHRRRLRCRRVYL